MSRISGLNREKRDKGQIPQYNKVNQSRLVAPRKISLKRMWGELRQKEGEAPAQ